MKTFNLCQLSYVQDEEEVVFPLEDGLIINKEDEGANWLIEAVMNKSQIDFFQSCVDHQLELHLRATITTGKNTPVPFEAKVRTIEDLNGRAHVLLNAVRSNLNY